MSSWDFLIVTASNDRQAEAYRRQLALRRELGFLAGIRDVLVVPDPPGRRVGSGTALGQIRIDGYEDPSNLDIRLALTQADERPRPEDRGSRLSSGLR